MRKTRMTASIAKIALKKTGKTNKKSLERFNKRKTLNNT
jgi:hypothetical protein